MNHIIDLRRKKFRLLFNLLNRRTNNGWKLLLYIITELKLLSRGLLPLSGPLTAAAAEHKMTSGRIIKHSLMVSG